jgi:hypothetical protein
VLGSIWVIPSSINSSPVAKSFESKAATNVKGFWRDSSVLLPECCVGITYPPLICKLMWFSTADNSKCLSFLFGIRRPL